MPIARDCRADRLSLACGAAWPIDSLGAVMQMNSSLQEDSDRHGAVEPVS
jgi:hypothetical protein